MELALVSRVGREQIVLKVCAMRFKILDIFDAFNASVLLCLACFPLPLGKI